MGPRCGHGLLSRPSRSTYSVTRFTLVGNLLAQLEVFHSQVIDHGLDLALVSSALRRSSREVELLLLCFKAAVARDKVSFSVRVHGLLPCVSAGCIRALGVESSFVGGAVRLRRLANQEVSLG